MRTGVLILLAFVAAGCASRANQNAQGSIPYKSFLTNNNANVQRLSVGMTKGAVLDVMKSYTTETPDGVVLNPMKTEAANVNGQTYEILYYLTQPHPQFKPIDDTQATPIVLKDGHVVGWGWNAARSIR